MEPHFTENFFFIPSLAGPTFEKGYGLGWLLDGDMDIGTKALYLVVPALLVASQIVNQQLNLPENQKQNAATRIIAFLPFLSGITASSSPAGIGLYWLTNSCVSLVQSQVVKGLLANEGLDMKAIQKKN